jgi:hypothetical protein
MRARSLLGVVPLAAGALAFALACSDEPNADTERPPLPEAQAFDVVQPLDAGADGKPKPAGSRCKANAPFSTVTRIAELSDPIRNEWSMRVDGQELTAIFTRQDNERQVILVATRLERDAPWGSPDELSGPWGTDRVGDPFVATASGAPTLFHSRSTGGPWTLHSIGWNGSTRSTVGASSPILALSGNDVSPVFVAASGELWFLRDVAGSFKLHKSTLADGGFSDPVLDPVLAGPFARNGTVAFTADGLTVYFGARPSGNAGAADNVDIYVATRPSLADPFSNVTPIPELNTLYWEQPLTISDDGCALYVASGRGQDGGAATTLDLFVALRGQ